MLSIFRRLLWVDCIAAAFGGVMVLALSGWLSNLHALPHGLLLFVGVVNLGYGTYSFSLARRAVRPMPLIKLLVYANAAWAIVCLALAAHFRAEATIFGLGHLVGEALFVGGLAAMEWNQKERLVTAT